jgi:hypothetical protein
MHNGRADYGFGVSVDDKVGGCEGHAAGVFLLSYRLIRHIRMRLSREDRQYSAKRQRQMAAESWSRLRLL